MSEEWKPLIEVLERHTEMLGQLTEMLSQLERRVHLMELETKIYPDRLPRQVDVPTGDKL